MHKLVDDLPTTRPELAGSLSLDYAYDERLPEELASWFKESDWLKIMDSLVPISSLLPVPTAQRWLDLVGARLFDLGQERGLDMPLSLRP
jgi:hypothetical protein